MHAILSALAPHLCLTAGALVVFCLGLLGRHMPRSAPLVVTLLSTAGATFAALVAYPVAHAGAWQAQAMALDTGAFAALYLPALCALAFLAALVTGVYALRRNFGHDEFHALLLLATLGMLLLAGGSGWLSFFLGLELLSIPAYVLIAARRGNAMAAEAALKYFALGATASAAVLFGIAMIYGGSGEMDIARSLTQPEGPGAVLLGLALVLAGMGFKISMAPFHLWAPDVYQGAPAPVAAFLTSGAKAAAVAGLLRVLLAVGPDLWPAVLPVLWIASAATMLAGNLGALAQSSLKRLLGYSSVAHMGYLLMAMTAIHSAGPAPVVYYSLALALMDMAAFGCIGVLSPLERDADDLGDLAGLASVRPWEAGVLAVSLLSLAGLPPTLGFTGKFLLFGATLEAGHVFLAVIGLLAAALSVFYYFRAVGTLFRGQVAALALPSTAFPEHAALAVLLVLLLLLGLVPGPILNASAQLATFLY